MPDQTETGINPLVKSIFDLGNAIAVPIVSRLAATRPADASTADQQTLAERIRWSLLNGSGPNDPNEAARAPQGVLDFITGQSGPGQTGGSNSSNTGKWLLIAGLGAVLVYLAVKR